MPELDFVYINATPLDWLQYSAKCKISDHINPIRKLIKLKEVVLGGLEELISDWKTTYKYFLEAPSLEKLAIKVRKSNLSKLKAELTTNIKDLKELHAEGYLDMSDLIYLIRTCTGLQKIRIFNLWHNDVEKALRDASLEDLQATNIKHLSLDTEISIRTPEVHAFYLKFIKAFANLEALKIGFKIRISTLSMTLQM